MKKDTSRSLKLTKISIAIIQELELKAIKGGTETVSECQLIVPMSQEPDEHTVCYQIK